MIAFPEPLTLEITFPIKRAFSATIPCDTPSGRSTMRVVTDTLDGERRWVLTKTRVSEFHANGATFWWWDRENGEWSKPHFTGTDRT